MHKHFVTRFIQQNKFIIVLLFILSFVVYGNSLRNEFAVVDDLEGFVNNETIRNIPASLKTFNLQTITNSFLYALFGMNPLPARILAIINHSIVAVLLYTIMYSVFYKKIALIAALLFVVHPVTTESIDWISGQFYIVMAIFLYSAVLSHILYRKTGTKKFLFLTAGIITLEFILIGHAWVLVVPAAIVVIDFFIVKKRFDVMFYILFGAALSPILFFFIFKNLFSSIEDRQVRRQAKTGGTLANQQLLAPIYEGYPYSVATLTRLYVFPKDLTMYYDGNPVTKTDLLYMKGILAIYIAAIVFFLYKDRRIAGLLILLLLLVAPVFSPQKITWYMTERYLYAGTGFFTTLVALAIVFLDKKISVKHFSVVVTSLLLVLYSIRTIIRNSDWQNPETLALATIKTSPYTVRPHNDIGGYYILQKRYDDAKKHYIQALRIGNSSTAMKNLGYIYLKTGFDPTIKTFNASYEEIVSLGMQAHQAQEYDQAIYFLNEAYAQNPSDIRVLNTAAIIFTDAQAFSIANDLLTKSKALDDSQADTYYVMGYTAFKQEDTPAAIEYLQQALLLDPSHAGAKTNLEFLLKN